ncbi:MAG: carboxylating nicotinate-nucleotide diphosphorylase [Bacteroidales bacterium]|jgi:nicotinate-nucleotide pyrophosphorylase (carboxylating)|nr:carboxylating nicotinate-nucleotide diphosphorylase [Bacteroidales bacterium]
MNSFSIDDFIKSAIKEDIGDGDHTSIACIPETNTGKAKLLVKQPGIIAGIEIAQKVFHIIDPSLAVEVFITDGTEVKYGDVAFIVSGNTQSILKSERLVLNIMQRMSGIATLTNEYVKKIGGTKAKILDTRKTTPGFRYFEKLAVKIGGGENHRMGLYDMIMLKDNHIDFAGGIKKAIEKTQDYLKRTNKNLKVEIEARTLNDVKEILSIGGVDRIMLDNFTPELTREAIALINGKIETESSGGINLETIQKFAVTGVDYISVGALTHQIKSLDLSLKAI